MRDQKDISCHNAICNSGPLSAGEWEVGGNRYKNQICKLMDWLLQQCHPVKQPLITRLNWYNLHSITFTAFPFNALTPTRGPRFSENPLFYLNIHSAPAVVYLTDNHVNNNLPKITCHSRPGTNTLLHKNPNKNNNNNLIQNIAKEENGPPNQRTIQKIQNFCHDSITSLPDGHHGSIRIIWCWAGSSVGGCRRQWASTHCHLNVN